MSSWIAFKWISTSRGFRNSSGYVFLTSSSRFLELSYRDFLELAFSMTDLTQKNEFWAHLWNFKFYEHLFIKVNSVHLSSAKHMP